MQRSVSLYKKDAQAKLHSQPVYYFSLYIYMR